MKIKGKGQAALSGFESSWRFKEFADEKNIPFWEISKEGDSIEL